MVSKLPWWQDAALWREQVAGTVASGGFDWEALDSALSISLLKYRFPFTIHSNHRVVLSQK